MRRVNGVMEFGARRQNNGSVDYGRLMKHEIKKKKEQRYFFFFELSRICVYTSKLSKNITTIAYDETENRATPRVTPTKRFV